MSRKQLRRLESEICRLHNLFVDDEGLWLGGITIASRMGEIREALTQAMRVRAEVMEQYRVLAILEEEARRCREAYHDAKTHRAASLAHSDHMDACRAVSAYREGHDL